MNAYWRTLADELKDTAFLERFFEIFIRNGYGSLPKREIEIVMLQLMMEHLPHLKQGDAPVFDMARNLRIAPRRLQNLLDEVSYRDTRKDDAWCEAQLMEALRNAEKIKDGAWVQLQIDDGLVRDFAKAKARAGFGVVDSSFNSAVVKLTGKSFAALALALCPAEQAALLDSIHPDERAAQQNKRKNKGPIRLFVDAFAKKAGETAGKELVEMGFDLLSGGVTAVKRAIPSSGQPMAA